MGRKLAPIGWSFKGECTNFNGLLSCMLCREDEHDLTFHGGMSDHDFAFHGWPDCLHIYYRYNYGS